jgi:site-specific recombinase XerD
MSGIYDNMKKTSSPRPLFDTHEYVQEQYKECLSNNSHFIISTWLQQCFSNSRTTLPDYASKDYQHVLHFLYSYRGSLDTFNSYRRELERLIQWSWVIQKKSISTLKRTDIETFIEFCQKPDPQWVGVKTVSRFIIENGRRQPNPEWRPFIVRVSKKQFQDGLRADISNFELSSEGVKQIFAILGSFYNYLIEEEISEINPISQIRQKSKFVRRHQVAPMIRRLSDQQWQAVINTAHQLATEDPEKHERTLFIMQTLYGMYLRISELTANRRWSPTMRDFFRDANGDWWFKTVGKGNKLRQIAVSDAMLEALKRWRAFLHLTGLPSPDEQTALIPKTKGKGAITSTRAIRSIVQLCFDKAIERLREEASHEESELLRSATVHWLRHTGISDDVKIRPREHVRDDAGHGSSAITDRYIDVELRERAKSAKNKLISG